VRTEEEALCSLKGQMNMSIGKAEEANGPNPVTYR
jgi:hypothetical protein